MLFTFTGLDNKMLNKESNCVHLDVTSNCKHFLKKTLLVAIRFYCATTMKPQSDVIMMMMPQSMIISASTLEL